MKAKYYTTSKIFFILLFFCSLGAFAQAPEKMSFQAVIRNAANNLVASQGVGLRVSILQGSASGTEVYKELFNPNPVTNVNGLVSVEIGTGLVITGTFASINWANGPYFIKAEIDPAGGTSYTVVSSTQLSSVPYALDAKRAQSVDGITGTATKVPKFLTTTTLGDSQINDDGTTVSINLGSSTAEGKLDVRTLAADTKSAIYGFSTSAASCLKGGVFGTYNTSNYGAGVQGVGYQGIQLGDGPATFPNLTATTDVGVYGSAATAGVIGTSAAGSGVRGLSSTSQGTLGYSQATTTGGAVGVGNTIGVFANAVTVGTATVPTTRYGVYGQASGATTNWAGYFNGNVSIVGSIAKGSGTFKIDHPLDPEHKYLYHSFVESPDMMNIYNGNITTDGSGYATVTMPDYFNALNKEFRYQLTVIGVFAQAIISKEIENNVFIIRTNQPNVKVSWQVTGVRKDKFAEAHRVQVEVTKEAENQGRYLHAKEWGQPVEKEINYEINSNQQADITTGK
ncbi:MAG: hypothetical protein QM710_07225 [Flavobacterium sp.]